MKKLIIVLTLFLVLFIVGVWLVGGFKVDCAKEQCFVSANGTKQCQQIIGCTLEMRWQRWLYDYFGINLFGYH